MPERLTAIRLNTSDSTTGANSSVVGLLPRKVQTRGVLMRSTGTRRYRCRAGVRQMRKIRRCHVIPIHQRHAVESDSRDCRQVVDNGSCDGTVHHYPRVVAHGAVRMRSVSSQTSSTARGVDPNAARYDGKDPTCSFTRSSKCVVFSDSWSRIRPQGTQPPRPF